MPAAILVAALLTVSVTPFRGGVTEGVDRAARDTITRITVRAVSHDAKVIGSGVGGARITITDAVSGRVLAEGVQEGSTGSTRLLVVEPRERGTPVYGAAGAAGYTAGIRLSEPTRVRVTAEGPLGTPHAVQSASKTLLLVPGVDLVGDGIIIELNGFTVRLEEPAPGHRGELVVEPGAPLPVRAHVTMLCGCPLEPGGLWDADRVRVIARLVRDGRILVERELDYAGSPSTFETTLTPPSPGSAVLRILALDPERGNTGMTRAALRVQ
jgi:hypothetical protein